jgi:hypothetical protein
MSKDIFERAISAIQRNRLENFVKHSFDNECGCFGFAVISCFNYLYPRAVLPRNIEDFLIQDTEGARVRLIDVIKEIKKLESYLNIKVDHIVNHTSLPTSVIKEALPPEDRVLVINSTDGWLYPEPNKSTAITMLQSKNNKNGGHYIPLVENYRFDENGFVTGGNSEYQRIKNDYSAGISFVVVKSD